MSQQNSEAVAAPAEDRPAQPARERFRILGLFRGALRELAVPTERRIPFLDGLRSIAVLLVINQHLAGAFNREYGANRYTHFPLTADGWIGVDLFFVLSGFFIGSQLWRELNATGTISFKRFVIRRGLRIWPLYFFIFLMVTLFNPSLAAAKQHGWTDLLFITNYTNHGIVLGSWSLCTEEQFYLLTPFVLLLVGRWTTKHYRIALGALLGLVLLVRGITFFVLSGHFFGSDPDVFAKLYYPFHTHCDGLISGLFVANLIVSKDKLGWLLRRPAIAVLCALVLMVVTNRIQNNVFNFTGLALFFAAVTWWGIQRMPQGFSHHIFYLLSRLSFGMYLNHDYMPRWILSRVLPSLGLMHLGGNLAALSGFVLLTLCSMAVSTVTFCLVEHPFLVLRTALLQRTEPHLTAH